MQHFGPSKRKTTKYQLGLKCNISFVT